VVLNLFISQTMSSQTVSAGIGQLF